MAAESDEIVSVVGNAAGNQMNGNGSASAGNHSANGASDNAPNSTQKDTNSNGDATVDHQDTGSCDPRNSQEVNRNVNGNKFRGE